MSSLRLRNCSFLPNDRNSCENETATSKKITSLHVVSFPPAPEICLCYINSSFISKVFIVFFFILLFCGILFFIYQRRKRCHNFFLPQEKDILLFKRICENIHNMQLYVEKKTKKKQYKPL